MSTLRVTTLQNTSGVEVYTCKAWVNFNGTGTVAIRGSGNVSSITDDGTGQYTVNFTNAMPDTNYSYALNGKYASDGGGNMAVTENRVSNSRTTSALKVTSFACSTGAQLDFDTVVVAIFR